MQKATLAILLLFVPACTRLNVPLNKPEVAWEQRTKNNTRAAIARRMSDRAFSPGTFVGISISGGGSRSANFASACLLEMQKRDLLDKVDVISGVSGGSLPAAYYCTASDANWNPGKVQEVMTHSFAAPVTTSVFLPWMWPALWFTPYSRSDVLAQEFDHVLFKRPDGKPMTFADLRKDRPQLILNATDLQSGANFTFTDELFDEMNSDLSKYPISLAVTASSAVPILLHHTTVQDYQTTFPRYRHLIDGGIFDNLGVLSMLEVYDRRADEATAHGNADPYPLGAVLIVIDSRTNSNIELSNERDIGFLDSLKYGVDVSSTAMLNHASNSNLADMVVKHTGDDVRIQDVRRDIEELRATGYVQFKDRRGRPVTVLHLAISRVKGLEGLSDNGFSGRVTTMGTFYNIEQKDAAELWQAARYLFERRFATQIVEIQNSLKFGTVPPARLGRPDSGIPKTDDTGLRRAPTSLPANP